MYSQDINYQLEENNGIVSHHCSSVSNVMLFDLSVYGHHPAYIQHLILWWHEHDFPGYLNIVVSPKFLTCHRDVVELISQKGIRCVNFVAIDSKIDAALKSRKSSWSRVQRAFQEWHILCKYAHQLKATHCLAMYFDPYQLSLAIGKTPPCPVSGIYFRPTFHYSHFSQFTPTWKTWLQQWREKILLSQVLRHSQFNTLFCLDPFAVKYLDHLVPGKTVALPDPVQVSPVAQEQVASLREQLGIEPERQIFLLFGSLKGRKGVYELLHAIAMLPDELGQKICLLLVGETNPQDRARIQSLISALQLTHPVQIISHHEFVPESDVQTYFHLADVVLAPYQRHVGMSGILIWAAVAQKPVLSSDYGLMGELVRHYQLGMTVNAAMPESIAQGIAQFLSSSPEDVCDRQLMQSFVAQNSADQFAQIILQTVTRSNCTS